MEERIKIRFAGAGDIEQIRELALEIWPPTYDSILSPQQLEYMLNLLYSPATLLKQLREQNHVFILASLDNKDIGFASWSAIEQPGVFKVHKLYLLPATQGKGIGKEMIDFICTELSGQKGTALRLNVNRHNKARQFYEKNGFKIIGEEDIDIGNNYFMNDYIMEKKLQEGKG